MSSVMERIENNQVVITFTVEKEEVAVAFDKAFKTVANKINVPGFRKGKAPRSILEKKVGKGPIIEEAFDLVANKKYGEALKEHNLYPIDNPEVTEMNFEEGSEASFKIKVTVKPEAEMGDYKGLVVDKKVVEITDEEVSKALADLQNSHATMNIVTEGKTEKGDVVMIDFAGSIDGVPFNGGEGKSYPLELGSGSFIPGFEEQLIGFETGSETVVKVTFPADYGLPELADKAAEFKVTIHEIKRKQLPELNDDFAKEVSFDNLEALKADTLKKLQETAKQNAENEYKDTLVKTAVENAKVEVPKVMIDAKVDNMLAEFAMSLEQRGWKLDQYLQYMGKSIEEFKEMRREAAAEQVKTEIVLDTIAKLEDIAVTAEEIEAEMQVLASIHNAKYEDVKKVIEGQGNIGMLITNIMRRKSAELIINAAKAE